jgi:hypothetical protein
METDQVGDAGGKGGNWKKNRPSQDLRGLKSDKRAEQQDCKGNLTDLRRILHLSLAKGNPK